MVLILLILLAVLLFAGLGFALHVLWIVAAVLLVVWLVGWVASKGAEAGSGSRRQWFGRW